MKHHFIVVFVLTTLVSCSPKVVVQTDYIKPVDFKNYRTFRFDDSKPAPNFTFNEANQERVRLAISEQMEKRNFIQSEISDLVIKVNGSIAMIRETGTNNFDPMWGWGRYDPFWMNNNRAPRDENQNTMIINVIDELENELIWQGVATGQFQQKKKHIEIIIREIVADIFNDFPVEPVHVSATAVQ